MKVMRRIVQDLAAAALALGLIAMPAAAREQSAHDFVAQIYAEHISPNEGFVLDTQEDYFRYFEPQLAWHMYQEDLRTWAHDRKAFPLYDYDPFVDGKTWSFTNVKIDVTRLAVLRATVTATFEERGVAKTITYDLVKLRAGWRIRDIHAPSGDLRARFSPP